MKPFLLLIIPFLLNEPSEFMDAFLLHKDLKSENKNITFCKKIYNNNDSVYKYEIFTYNENSLLVNESQYYFKSDCHYNLKTYSYTDSSISYFSSLDIGKRILSNKEISVKLYKDSLVSINKIFKTTVTKFNDSTIIKEFHVLDNGDLRPWATYIYYNNRVFSVYNELEKDYEYLFEYNGDTTFVNFVLPLHPLGENVLVGYKSYYTESLMIIINRNEKMKKKIKFLRGENLLGELTFLNSSGLDSITFRGHNLSKENYAEESDLKILYEYGYSKR